MHGLPWPTPPCLDIPDGEEQYRPPVNRCQTDLCASERGRLPQPTSWSNTRSAPLATPHRYEGSQPVKCMVDVASVLHSMGKRAWKWEVGGVAPRSQRRDSLLLLSMRTRPHSVRSGLPGKPAVKRSYDRTDGLSRRWHHHHPKLAGYGQRQQHHAGPEAASMRVAPAVPSPCSSSWIAHPRSRHTNPPRQSHPPPLQRAAVHHTVAQRKTVS